MAPSTKPTADPPAPTAAAAHAAADAPAPPPSLPDPAPADNAPPARTMPEPNVGKKRSYAEVVAQGPQLEAPVPAADPRPLVHRCAPSAAPPAAPPAAPAAAAPAAPRVPKPEVLEAEVFPRVIEDGLVLLSARGPDETEDAKLRKAQENGELIDLDSIPAVAFKPNVSPAKIKSEAGGAGGEETMEIKEEQTEIKVEVKEEIKAPYKLERKDPYTLIFKCTKPVGVDVPGSSRLNPILLLELEEVPLAKTPQFRGHLRAQQLSDWAQREVRLDSSSDQVLLAWRDVQIEIESETLGPDAYYAPLATIGAMPSALQVSKYQRSVLGTAIDEDKRQSPKAMGPPLGSVQMKATNSSLWYGGEDLSPALAAVAEHIGLAHCLSSTNRGTITNLVAAVWLGTELQGVQRAKEALVLLGHRSLYFIESFTNRRVLWAYFLFVLNYAPAFESTAFVPEAVAARMKANPAFERIIGGVQPPGSDSLVHKFVNFREPPTAKQLSFFLSLTKPGPKKIESGLYLNVEAVALPPTKAKMTDFLSQNKKATLGNTDSLKALFEAFETPPPPVPPATTTATTRRVAAPVIWPAGNGPADTPVFSSAISATRGLSAINLLKMIFEGTVVMKEAAAKNLVRDRIRYMLVCLGFPADLKEFSFGSPETMWRIFVSVINHPDWFTSKATFNAKDAAAVAVKRQRRH